MSGQNDILQFDENKDNILTQEVYASDTERLNGVKTGWARSILLNKVLRQCSMVASAIGEVMKNRGQVAQDAVFADLVTAMSTALPNASENISYDNASSGLTATDAQSAIDEVFGYFDNIQVPQPLNIPFSVNSGLTSINKVSNNEVSFTLGSGGCVATFPSGKTYILTTINNVTGISADGTYDFVIEEADITGGNTVTPKAVLTSKISETLANGTGGSDGDYNLNIQVRPLYPQKKISGTWTATQYLKLGNAVRTSGTLATPVVYAFNGFAMSSIMTGATNTSLTFQDNLGTTLKEILIRRRFNSSYAWTYQQKTDYWNSRTNVLYGYSPVIKSDILSVGDMGDYTTTCFVGLGDQEPQSFPVGNQPSGEVQFIVRRLF